MLNVQNVRKIIKASGGVQLNDPSYINRLILSNSLNIKDAKGLNFTNTPGFRTKAAGALGTIGMTTDMLGSFIPQQNNSALTLSINTGYDAIADAAMMFAPIGTIIGGAMKLGGFASKGILALGGGTDLMTTTDLIFDSAPGTLLTLGLNGFLGKKTQDFAANTDVIGQIGSSYGDTVNDINLAVRKANKKYGWFSNNSRRKANSFINQARINLNLMADIANDAEDLRLEGANTTYNSLNYQNIINGGFDPRYSLVAKEGAKLIGNINLNTKEIEWEPTINNLEPSWEPVIEFKNGGIIDNWEPIIEFKKGGLITKESSLKNVIPEGNLHARLHHMDNDKNITKKGIPVIDDNGELQAEIELNEIIFTLEVTLKLETLYHKFLSLESSQKEKDEMAIEAGKLLVNEILFNTDDRTGLINTLLKGGTL